MAGVTGFGGAFMRVDDPEALARWYEQHLGLAGGGGFFGFPAAAQRAEVVLAFLPREGGSFPDGQAVMLNLQVDDLDAVLDRLIGEGVEVEERREASEHGRFGWLLDLEGNRVELWQPPG